MGNGLTCYVSLKSIETKLNGQPFKGSILLQTDDGITFYTDRVELKETCNLHIRVIDDSFIGELKGGETTSEFCVQLNPTDIVYTLPNMIGTLKCIRDVSTGKIYFSHVQFRKNPALLKQNLNGFLHFE